MFAAKRDQYKAAQEAMRASENIVKGIRKELTNYIAWKSPAIWAVIPDLSGKTKGGFTLHPDTGGRAAAADKPFGVLAIAYKVWHDITPEHIAKVIGLMEADGWRHLETIENSTSFKIRFN